LSISNYWAVINGSYADYVGGGVLTPINAVSLVSDRLGNVKGAFQTLSSSYAQAPSGIYFPGSSFSITMWIMAVTVPYGFMDFGNGASNDNLILLLQRVYLYSANINTAINYPTPLSTNAWMHYAITYNSSGLICKVYVNGAIIATATGQSLLRNVTRVSNYFGRDSWGYFANVAFDEVKIHSRALSAQEVLNDAVNNQSYISFI
jgi:hypothetical protein